MKKRLAVDYPKAIIRNSLIQEPIIIHQSPPSPIFRANPFPEVTDPFCRLPLPTLF